MYGFHLVFSEHGISKSSGFQHVHVLCTLLQGTILLENVSSGTEGARPPQAPQVLISPQLIYFCTHYCLIQNRHQSNVWEEN